MKTKNNFFNKWIRGKYFRVLEYQENRILFCSIYKNVFYYTLPIYGRVCIAPVKNTIFIPRSLLLKLKKKDYDKICEMADKIITERKGSYKYTRISSVDSLEKADVGVYSNNYTKIECALIPQIGRVYLAPNEKTVIVSKELFNNLSEEQVKHILNFVNNIHKKHQI